MSIPSPEPDDSEVLFNDLLAGQLHGLSVADGSRRPTGTAHFYGSPDLVHHPQSNPQPLAADSFTTPSQSDQQGQDNWLDNDEQAPELNALDADGYVPRDGYIWTPHTGEILKEVYDGDWDGVTPRRYYKWLTSHEPYKKSMASSNTFLKDSHPGGVCRLLRLSSNELQSVLALLPLRQLILVMGTCKRIQAEITHHNSLVTRRFKDFRALPGESDYPQVNGAKLVDDDNIPHLIPCKNTYEADHDLSQSMPAWVASYYLRKYLPVRLEMVRGLDCGFEEAERFGNIIAVQSLVPHRVLSYGFKYEKSKWSASRCQQLLSLLESNLNKFTSFECVDGWTHDEVLTGLLTRAPNLTSLTFNLLPSIISNGALSGSCFSLATNLTRLTITLATNFNFNQLKGMASIPHLTDCIFWFSQEQVNLANYSSMPVRPITEFETSFECLPTTLGLTQLQSIQFWQIRHAHIDHAKLILFFNRLPQLVSCQTDHLGMKAYWDHYYGSNAHSPEKLYKMEGRYV